MMLLPTAAQMRALDEGTILRIGISGGVLMESAGRSVVTVLFQLAHSGRLQLDRARVIIVAGPGNNGGDGMVIARYLHELGQPYELWIVADRARIRGDALLHLIAAERAGVAPTFCDGQSDELRMRLLSLSSHDVVIDALLGTGLQRTVSGSLACVIQHINSSPACTLAVDLPSGLDADRGVPTDAPSQPVIVRADFTVTLGFPKLGLVSSPGFLFAGEVFVADIGIAASLGPQHKVGAQLADAAVLAPLHVPRSPVGHKGSHGHLLIVAGSSGKVGAALLATEAALHVGVGLCTLALSDDALDGSVGSRCPEAMTLPYQLRDDSVDPQLLAGQSTKSALAIGPGLAPTVATKRLVSALLDRCEQPVLLDAEALNQLADDQTPLRVRAQQRRSTVLTPHPGEAARLLQTTSAEIQRDRVSAVRALAEQTGAVVLLKGARTLIAEPLQSAGQTPRLVVVPTGNPGMGSGGMGDVLTGMIGALLASGWPVFEAACAGAYWHGLAGDLVAAQRPASSIVLATQVTAALDQARDCARKVASGNRPWPIVPLAWAQGRG